ncbi:MAG: PAS domain-containing protein, partial [Methanospirillum sp.]
MRYPYSSITETIPVPSVPLDAIQQPAILYGADARIVAANERAEALAGRPLVGLSVAEKLAILETRRSDGSPIPVDDLPVLRALRGEAVVDEPLDITAADGRTAHILAAASPLRDNDAVTGALVVWQDVTALVAARGALRESEERLRSMAENVPSVLMRYDAAMRVVYLSPQAEHFTGIPTEQFIGRTNREVGMPGDLCDRWEAAIAGVFRTGMPADMEFSFPSPEGQRLFLLKFAPERGPDGAVQHVLGVSTEITERMKTGAALAQSRATLQAALGSMADAVFVSDADGRFVEFNDAFVAYHRFGSRDECSRTFETCSTLFVVWFGETGEPAPPERWAVPRALAGESGTGVEYMLRRRDTGETWIGQYNFAPLRDEDGVIFGSVVTARDITEQKRAERELAASDKKNSEHFERMK